MEELAGLLANGARDGPKQKDVDEMDQRGARKQEMARKVSRHCLGCHGFLKPGIHSKRKQLEQEQRGLVAKRPCCLQQIGNKLGLLAAQQLPVLRTRGRELNKAAEMRHQRHNVLIVEHARKVHPGQPLHRSDGFAVRCQIADLVVVVLAPREKQQKSLGQTARIGREHIHQGAEHTFPGLDERLVCAQGLEREHEAREPQARIEQQLCWIAEQIRWETPNFGLVKERCQIPRDRDSTDRKQRSAAHQSHGSHMAAGLGARMLGCKMRRERAQQSMEMRDQTALNEHLHNLLGSLLHRGTRSVVLGKRAHKQIDQLEHKNLNLGIAPTSDQSGRGYCCCCSTGRCRAAQANELGHRCDQSLRACCGFRMHRHHVHELHEWNHRKSSILLHNSNRFKHVVVESIGKLLVKPEMRALTACRLHRKSRRLRHLLGELRNRLVLGLGLSAQIRQVDLGRIGRSCSCCSCRYRA
eukprot:comp22098_c0_seq2/m.51327 comp22098_c0_seq2/g.51327  ORF comp22098_c0_seq2/g.51327 comp22098_c0_seq2/m.51327 type:complete len:469 (-) comp22098_c0_seq2:419-1825(-)